MIVVVVVEVDDDAGVDDARFRATAAVVYGRRVSERESFLRRFHALHPGATSQAFARTDSYARLASLVTGRERVLDLACGDGPLLAELGPRALGIDLSREELAITRIGGRVVQGRAQALPFADGSFDAVACHLAFMLFDDIERVVAELARVIVPGGVFAALLGGGPVELAESDRQRDAFHRFLAVGSPHVGGARFGDPRAKSPQGWRDLFAGWSEPTFERIELELGGTFDHAWDFLGASYQLDPVHADRVRDELRVELGDHASCKVVCWLASVTR